MEEKNNLTAWERWELASLEEGMPVKPHPLRAKTAKAEPPPSAEAKPPTVEDIEQVHRQARESGYQEGFQAGRQAGLEAGQREGKAQGEKAAQQLLATAAKLDAALAELDQAVTDELAALSLEIAREVLRQTLAIQPETVVGVVRDALTHLPHQHANIYLHPDDAALVRSYAGDQLSHAGHRIHEDGRLHRNDVLIEASGAQVDATLTSRWRRVVESLGQRVIWDGTPPQTKPPDAEQDVTPSPAPSEADPS